MVLALTTGLRRGELIALKWSDTEFEASRLSVRRSLAVVNGRQVESDPKTRRGRRSVSFDAATLTALRQHRVEQAALRLALGPSFRDHDYIFPSESGKARHPDSVTKRFETLRRRAGLRRIRFHDLRHTHATLALQAGIHPKVVSERLGHARVSVTLDTYSHAVPTLEAAAAEKVSALIWPHDASAGGVTP